MGKLYHNPDPNEPSNFLSVVEVNGIKNMTETFNGSVGKAMEYFKENPYKHTYVVSKRKQDLYHNPNRNDPTYFETLRKLIFIDVDHTITDKHTRGIYEWSRITFYRYKKIRKIKKYIQKITIKWIYIIY